MNSVKKLTKLQNDLIEKVAKDEGFENYKTVINSGSMRGDGYMGIIYTVQITNQDNNKKLNLILKTAFDSDELRKQTPIRKAYQREIELYTKIFPLFDDLKSPVNVDVRSNFTEMVAKCYGFLDEDKNECILLENLKEIGYKLWDRKVPMNSDHISLIFQVYGKLHACSQILKRTQPEVYRIFENDMENIYQDDTNEQNRNTFFGMIENIIKAVEDDEKIQERLKDFGKDLAKFMLEDSGKKGKLSVICHGDNWCNNMLFKYEDLKNPAKPTNACLLDWQVAHINSPVCDLSYFFYCSASKELLYELKKFLTAYYNSFSDVLRRFDCDPIEIMTFRELEDEWKSTSKYGMFLASLLIKIMLTESSEALDWEEIADSGESVMEAMQYNPRNLEEYNKRLSDIVHFMAENDYL